MLRLSAPGEVSFDDKGRTIWKETAEGKDRYILWNRTAGELTEYIDRLLAKRK